MIKTASQGYAEAVTADARRTIPKVVIDIIDPDLTFGEVEASPETEYSRKEQVIDRNFDNPPQLATLENNMWLLNGGWDVRPKNPADIPELEQVGFESEAMCDEDGVFSPAVYIDVNIGNVDVLQVFTLKFSDNPAMGYPTKFTVEVQQAGNTYFTKEYKDNTETLLEVTGFTVYYADKIRLTISEWSLPYRRARVVEVYPGIYKDFGEKHLAGINIKQQGDPSNLNVPYGTCSIEIDNQDRAFEARNKSGLFQSLEDRQNIDVQLGMETARGIEFVRVGKFFQYQGGWKISDNGLTISWDLVDIVGLLADRAYIAPATLPTTLEGWVKSLVSQLGTNFSEEYIIDPEYASTELLLMNNEDVDGLTCGDLLKYVCMATGTWFRADSESGKLAVEPLWNEGNKVTLENMNEYPVITANDDLAAIIFEMPENVKPSSFAVSGNSTAASATVTVKNPFIYSAAQAAVAARMILQFYGGNRYELVGRGNPLAEIGDVETIWLDESNATTARKIEQTFEFTDGVMQGCSSVLIQPDGAFLYENREVFTENTTWTAPAGVSSVRIILIGKGEDGKNGTSGTWDNNGMAGENGRGGKVYVNTIRVNNLQQFEITVGDNSTFGSYSSADGDFYAGGYVDIASGDAYARTGVKEPLDGTGDGGKGGSAGKKGNRRIETYVDEYGWTHEKEIIDNRPKAGGVGAKGALGAVVIYYDKPTE